MLEADRDQLEVFVNALFRHCGADGFVSLRSFYEEDDAKPFRISPVSLAGGLRHLINRAEDDACCAANAPRSVVFCPPIATFHNGDHAREKDLLAGLSLSVELDQHPHEARRALEDVLGPATLVVRSGGRWCDPETGDVENKLHVHWRLARPACGSENLARLKRARDLAAHLVGADRSNLPVVHPL